MPDALEPLFDYVLIREREPDTQRKSGVVLPQQAVDHRPPQEGFVIACGPGLDWWEAQGIEMPVKPGDHVMFPWNAGTWVEVNEERLLMLRVGQLMGRVVEVKGAPSLTEILGRREGDLH